MIVFIGDLHGAFEWLPTILKNVPRYATLIQVGDFGFWPGHYEMLWKRYWVGRPGYFPGLGFEKPMHIIDGNHEYFPMFYDKTEPTEIWEGALYIPRGTVMEIDGLRIGFMGGGGSVDYKLRKLGVDWFLEEQISDEQFEKLYNADPVDILVTHVPPTNITELNFPHPSVSFPSWRIPSDWKDASQDKVQKIWEKHGEPPLICGHMHKSVIYDNVRILEINEVYEWRSI